MASAEIDARWLDGLAKVVSLDAEPIIRHAAAALRGETCTVCHAMIDSNCSVPNYWQGLPLCSRHSDYFASRPEYLRDWTQPKPAPAWSGGPAVYYVVTGTHTPDGDDVLKIGTTTSFEARMRSHRNAWPFMEVAAVESGGAKIEKQRHAEFRHLRIPQATELFVYTRELRSFTDVIAATMEVPA